MISRSLLIILFAINYYNFLITVYAEEQNFTEFNEILGIGFGNSSIDNQENNQDIVKKVIAKKCARKYSSTCFKIDVAKFVDKLGATDSYQILPGISIVRTESSSWNKSDMPTEIVASVVRSNSTPKELDAYLIQKMDRFLSTLSIKVKLLDNPFVRSLKKIGSKVFTSIIAPTDSFVTGRGKKNKHDYQAAIWSAATLAALGFAGLAAMSGKAMMTATVALVLSILCLLKGCGGHGKSAHYEIITKPAHLTDVEHVHASGLNSPYGYARNFVEERVIPALSVLDVARGQSDEVRNIEAKIVPIRSYHTNQGQTSYVPTTNEAM